MSKWSSKCGAPHEDIQNARKERRHRHSAAHFVGVAA
jgi:hypothetical protein